MQAVAVGAAMGIGLLIGILAFKGGSSTPATHVTTAQLTSLPSGAKAIVRQTGGHAELVIYGIPQPPPGKIYELWIARAGVTAPQPTNALFDVTHTGGASVNVPGNLVGVQQVLVTAEPVGGSSHPTSTPIIAAKLHS
jgi:hypothetical protein